MAILLPTFYAYLSFPSRYSHTKTYYSVAIRTLKQQQPPLLFSNIQ